MAVLSGTCHGTLACPEPALETEAPGQALALGRCQHAHIICPVWPWGLVREEQEMTQQQQRQLPRRVLG